MANPNGMFMPTITTERSSVASPEPSAGRENNFNFLRIFFATAVIFSHSFPLVGSRSEPLENLVGRQTYAAELAVNGFFAISGMLVTQSWLRSAGWWDYLKKRLLRIYPGYIVAALFCLLVAGPLGASSPAVYMRSIDPIRFLKQIVQLSAIDVPAAFIGNPLPGSINGSLWTIKIEFECYLLVAALGLAGLLRRRRFVCAVFLATATLSVAIHFGPVADWAAHHVSFGVLASTVLKARLVAYFTAGMVFCLFRDRIRITPAGVWAAAIISFVAAALGILVAVMPLTGSYLLFAFAYSDRVRLYRFGSRFDLSYGTYLFAWPLQQLIVFYSANRVGPYALFFAATLMSYGLAMVSWTLVEHPFLSLKRRGRMTGKLECERETGDRPFTGSAVS